MVQDSRKTLCADPFKQVNTPEPVQVEEDSSCLPVAVKTTRKQAVTVTAIEDRWRIDDEWWRSEPISRIYYTVMLASLQRLTLYKDLVNKSWYRQAY